MKLEATKLEVIELDIMEDIDDSGIKAISLVTEPATDSYWVYFKSEKPKAKEVKLSIDEDKRIIVGSVMLPDIEIYREPLKEGGEPFYIKFSAEAIRKMSEKYMKDLKLKDNDIEHEENNDAGSYVFESWIVQHEQDKANEIYKLDVPIGTWIIAMKIESDETWGLVKDGTLKGFSLYGNFIHKEDIEELMAKDLIDKIKGILLK